MIKTMLADALFKHSSVTVGDGGGGGLIHALFVVLIVGICVGLIWAAGRWVITKMAAPAMAMTIWNGFFILVGLIIVVNFLLSLVGYGFIAN